MQQTIFVWDSYKAEVNLRKHGVAFEEAATVFRDPLLLVVPDMAHSDREERWVAMGKSRRDILLVVIHTESHQRIRIISARKAEPKERRDYEEQ